MTVTFVFLLDFRPFESVDEELWATGNRDLENFYYLIGFSCPPSLLPHINEQKFL